MSRSEVISISCWFSVISLSQCFDQLGRFGRMTRPETQRLWWSDQARLPQESQDHKEDCAAFRVYRVQGQRLLIF
jgi:hypothetical protein